jgi:hypothetical protein
MSNIVPGPGFNRGFLESSGGGGHDGGMSDLSARVERLEKDVAEIKTILGRVEPVLNAFHGEFREMRGRSNAMPSSWQLITLIIAVIGVMGLIANFTFARLDRMDVRLDRIESRIESLLHPAVPK